MYFQTFHDLAYYAASKPADFNSVSPDDLEEFIYEHRKEVHRENVYSQDSPVFANSKTPGQE